VHKIVFATSLGFDGNLGGLAGADMKCQARAQAAGLPGTYLAWLSDPTGSPLTRFTQSTIPYVRRDGVKVADDWADLTDGSLDAPINRSETGGQPFVGTASCNLNGNPVKGLAFTNTLLQGNQGFDFLSCNSWSTNSVNQTTAGGHWSSANTNWTQLQCTYHCGNKEALYCLQQ
jgi:hypothetical protein